MTLQKPVLDATCGCRAMWFDKKDSRALFCDARNGKFNTHDGRVLEVSPDIQTDFRNMPFPDDSFWLVIWDPPHRSDLTKGNWMDIQYGTLLPTWEDDLRQGFNECMRVLKPNGTLIFKWNEKQIKLSRVLNAIGHKPLFGHTKGKTIWMTFMKSES